MQDERATFQHRYFSTYPIADPRMALWFSKKTTYDILELLWKAGPRGLTPKQVVELLKKTDKTVSTSKVYATLKDFYESDIVDREWDNEAKAHRNILRVQYLPANLDDEYEEWIDDNLGSLVERKLFPAFLNFLTETMNLIREKKIPAKFMPKQGKYAWCDRCHSSHEAYFFFLSLLYYAACNFVGLEWEFDDPELGKSIANLYATNRLADPDNPPEISRHDTK